MTSNKQILPLKKDSETRLICLILPHPNFAFLAARMRQNEANNL